MFWPHICCDYSAWMVINFLVTTDTSDLQPKICQRSLNTGIKLDRKWIPWIYLLVFFFKSVNEAQKSREVSMMNCVLFFIFLVVQFVSFFALKIYYC